jgi:hypothetical protein
MNLIRSIAVAALTAALGSCGGKSSLTGGGGGGGGSGNTIAGPGPNVATIVANAGPANSDVDTIFTSVTICAPGSTTNCQTIDNIEVDTGSSGLRILGSVLTVLLDITQDAQGNSYGECAQFVDGYSWGPLALADVTISGEKAASLPIQVIGDSHFAGVPAPCAATSNNPQDTVAQFGANGILGVATTATDCGSSCASNIQNGFYYACPGAANCGQSTIPLASQVQNPVFLFATDNNGVIIELPAVASAGAASATGALVFGIDTQTNNGSGSATVFAVSPSTGPDGAGFLPITANGTTFTDGFLDTGSNGYYFDDSALPACTQSSYTGFYCPSSTQSLTASLAAYSATGASSTTTSVTISIANAENLLATYPALTAFNDLAGSFQSSNAVNANITFDMGLPFFFGRNVYEAFEGKSSSAGTGPYVAF